MKFLAILPVVMCLAVRTAYASDAKSFFAYIKEIAEPAPAANGRESRQFSITFSLNGASNFTFNVANIPTNFPISCGGDDRNYCNYPDLPLIETYDLNYYSRRPIPSGRCPDGYTKMPTFDCLNIAPALFETTCCMYISSTIPNICSPSTVIDAMWTLCNGSIYISSGSYAWQYTSTFQYVQGPVLLAGLTGGCVSSNLAEAEVDGECNVEFFNMNDQYFVVDYQTGSLGCTGASAVTNLGITGTPSLAYGLGRGTIIYHIDGDGFQAVLSDGYNFICGGNITNNIAVQPPASVAGSPYVNCTAATYIPASDQICYICNPTGAANVVYCTTRAGVATSGPTALSSLLSNCGATSSNTAPLVYIPYPIYPVFTGNNNNNNGYGSSPSSSYGSSPSSPSSSYGSSPASSPSASYG